MTLVAAGAVVRQGSFELGPLDFRLASGAVTVVIGANGSGKSTLLRAAAGVLAAHAGRIELEGEALASMTAPHRAARLAYVAQRPESVAGFSVRTSVELGRVALAADASRVREAMERTGIAALADAPVGRLSEGQRHRVAFARALAQRTPRTRLLIVDEPTSALDPAWAGTLAAQLRECAAEGLAVLVATHDFAFAGAIADHAIALAQGRIAAAGATPQVLHPAVLEPMFGVAFRLVDGLAPRPLCVAVWSPGDASGGAATMRP
jgi:iron complex transport system ATP-binding protein